MPLTINQLQIGQKATVQDVSGDDPLALRLMEMGLLPGSDVEFIGRAPLGDPIEIRLSGYHLSLRQAEASRVIVDPS